jgi:hypothetical protein
MKKIKKSIKQPKLLSTEIIEDRDMLDALRRAIVFENGPAKQISCYYCGERHGPLQLEDTTFRSEVPDEWTCSKGHVMTSRGWEWSDVANMYQIAHRMIRLGICKIVSKSNKHTYYRLTDRQRATNLVKNSEKHFRGELLPVQPKTEDLPNDLFDNIVGYEDVKRLMKKVVVADTPIHLLLIGPPASAKTMFQMELEKLPGSYFTDGANVSKAGLNDILFNNEIRYLLIDEMEEMEDKDVAGLVSFMQTGRLSETKFGRSRIKHSKTWVFGSCNTTERFSQKLLSRFLKLEFSLYSYDQFMEIVIRTLGKTRPGMTRTTAEKIGSAVWNKLGTKDMRDVVKIASLVDDNEKDLDFVIETLTKYKQ